jgi:hypothetical protein
MLFGQSVFQSVLDRLKADNDLAEHDSPTTTRVHGFKTGLAFDVMEGVSVSSARPDQAYLDNLGVDRPAEIVAQPAETPAAPPQPEPVMPDHLTRISPEEIAAELAISSRDTVQNLREKRRSFAKVNHPDGVALLFRENATRRMTIANLMIDEALKRLSR